MGGWWLVSMSPGVWNALNLIHSRGPDIQHHIADSPNVIGSQGNLQLSQDLGGFLNSSSEFLQKKKKMEKKRRRGALIFLKTHLEIASHHTGGTFFLRGWEERNNQTQPQTTQKKLNWLIQMRVSGTSNLIHSLGGSELPTH